MGDPECGYPAIRPSFYNSGMADEPIIVPANRLWRWLVLATLLIGAIALYFRDASRLQSFDAGTFPTQSDSR
ncbi:MAG TPA: hypothetical protein VMH88_08540 [Gemmatimonadales bacterium]|nr:hypothetical protein [Gemmatimonadales bacterium]